MIAHVNGIISEMGIDYVVIDVNGIGYNVLVPSSVIYELPEIGNTVKLYTYTYVREDCFSLYGFINKNSLNLFKKLITVSGIGPKGALALLSVMDTDTLRFAILSGDAKLISSAPGIGKKTAERVILDLKDKLTWDNELINREINASKITLKRQDNPVLNEAIEALVALGYGSKEANNAVSKVEVNEDMDVEAILKASLAYLL